MAASLSRPDPSSPASVAEAGFSTTRRGYHQDEVRAFLTSVAAELGRLQERGRRLEAELDDLRDQATTTVELDDETVANLLGEETLRVLHTARESASEIKIRAEENAARILREANDEANRLRQEAEVEAARKRQDASSDAEAEVALAKQQGREMVNEARSYRERVLADLERRTTLARHQIEELVHGRDRLLQVFERARLVAVDVTSELQSLDGPDELVNLSPTTGPVPLMVKRPRHRPTPNDEAESDGAGDSSDTSDTSDEAEADVPPGPVGGDTTDDEHADTDVDSTTGDGEAHTAVDVAVPVGSDAAGDEDAEGDSDDDDGYDDDGYDDDGYDDDGYDDEAVAVEDAGDAADASSRRDGDANVVSLFRGRSPAHDADQADTDQADTDQADTDAADHDAADHAGEAAGEGDPGADTSTGPRPDVGGIFERLRSEVPTVDNALAEAPDTDQSGGDDEAPPPEPTPFTRRDEALVPLILAGARKLKRVLADEQNGVLDTLRRNEPVTSVDALLPPLDEHLRRYVDGLAEDLVAAAATGATEVGLNDTKTLRRKLANAGALDGAHALLASDLVGPLRDRLGRSIAEGDGDNDEITKRIRAVYREWKTQHIDDQLDDVFRFAHGGGIATIVEPGRPMTWTIDPQQPACPDCEDNSLAGTVAAGEAYPTGHTSAPGHPGCRCMTVPASG